MEFRQLKYFVSAAKHLNFTKAAQECFIVQSAMTKQMAMLEQELETPLFQRHGRSLELTPEGKAFLLEAKRLLTQADKVKSFVKDVSTGYSESLTIGYQGNLLKEDMPLILREYKTFTPSTKVILKQGNIANLVECLQKEAIDCMISTYWPFFELEKWMKTYTICKSRVKVMVSAQHPLSARQSVKIEELKNEKFILFTSRGSDSILASWAQIGAPMIVYDHLQDHSSIELLVAAQYGISLCADVACNHENSGLSYLDIENYSPEIQIVLSFNETAQKKKHVEAYIDLLTRYFASKGATR